MNNNFRGLLGTIVPIIHFIITVKRDDVGISAIIILYTIGYRSLQEERSVHSCTGLGACSSKDIVQDKHELIFFIQTRNIVRHIVAEHQARLLPSVYLVYI